MVKNNQALFKILKFLNVLELASSIITKKMFEQDQWGF